MFSSGVKRQLYGLRRPSWRPEIRHEKMFNVSGGVVHYKSKRGVTMQPLSTNESRTSSFTQRCLPFYFPRGAYEALMRLK